ncbi:MAG: hypothetical protein Q4G25_16265, partial [Paracoccus sp. (in: a-proteobacteria)]|nr:hypothetical protein [Paracoccus sp. (in: a-proteobacteria)]
RLACLRAEMAVLRDYLPETADHLAGATEAVILTTRRTGPLRVLMRETEGVLYPAWSGAPLGAAMPANPAAAALIADGPAVLQWLYRHWMDGLTDIWEFGGLLNSRAITSMAEDGDVFGEMDWYDDLDHHHDLNRWIRIFSSGGGGYLLVDLDDPALRGDDPEAIQVLVKEAESLHRVPLFAYLDGWSAIAMGADDPA